MGPNQVVVDSSLVTSHTSCMYGEMVLLRVLNLLNSAGRRFGTIC